MWRSFLALVLSHLSRQSDRDWLYVEKIPSPSLTSSLSQRAHITQLSTFSISIESIYAKYINLIESSADVVVESKSTTRLMELATLLLLLLRLMELATLAHDGRSRQDASMVTEAWSPNTQMPLPLSRRDNSSRKTSRRKDYPTPGIARLLDRGPRSAIS